MRAKSRAELINLFQRLFADCGRIIVRPLTGGLSDASVLRVDILDPPSPTVIVKIGPRGTISRESANWDKYVSGRLKAFTFKLDDCYTENLGGIIYSLVGWTEDLFDFAAYYQQNSAGNVKKVIDRLFGEICVFWYLRKDEQLNLNLSDSYRERLGIPHNIDSLQQEIFTHELSGYLNQVSIRFPGVLGLFPNPVNWIADRKDYKALTYLCTIHGDLNERNILIDGQGAVWLIDFATTGKGYILQDFAKLESVVRLALLNPQDPADLYAFEQALLKPATFGELDDVKVRNANNDVRKAVNTIKRIRFHARNAVPLPPNRNAAEYYVSLFYETLNRARDRFRNRLSLDQRQYAWLSACMICRRLDELPP